MTHGQLGDELLACAQKIVGDVGHFKAVSIGWHDDVEASKAKLEEVISTVDSGKGVIILTDMFGGTPSNISLSVLRGGLEVVTGVNLPMVIKLLNQKPDDTLEGLALKLKEQGQRQISVASELLGR